MCIFIYTYVHTHTIPGASCNVKVKCKGCDRQHDISFADEGHDEAGHGWHKGGDEFQRFASFECRGLDPVSTDGCLCVCVCARVCVCAYRHVCVHVCVCV